MKTQVVINEQTVKTYYKDIFLTTYLPFEIIAFICGAIGFGYYTYKGNILGGTGLFAIGVFVILVSFYINRNTMRSQITELGGVERSYDVEFKEESMEVGLNSKVQSINYKDMRIRKLPHYYQVRTKDKNSKVYIIPRSSFKDKEWDDLNKRMNKIIYSSNQEKEVNPND